MRNIAKRTDIKVVQAKESLAHVAEDSAGWLFLINSATDLVAEEWLVPLLSSSVDSEHNNEAWVKLR